MSIIEREIEKREALIKEQDEAQAEALKLREQANKFEAHAKSIDVVVLMAEIEELKQYLPKPDEACGIEATETTAEAVCSDCPSNEEQI